MFIDTHCHLMMDQFNQDLTDVIANAKKAGVTQIISPAVDAYSSQQTIAIARKNPGVVFAAVGFHPYEANQNPQVHLLEPLINKSVVAIGEIGLDYHLYKGEPAAGKKQEQKVLFEEQLRLALRHDLPVIMHCRDAYEDFFTVLDGLPSMPRGVIHCFSGGLQEARMAADRKLFVGVDGNITYSKQLIQIHAEIPLSMLLLETDAPYLTPIPHRGQRNEPKYIPLIAQKIADIHNKPIDEIARQTTANAELLFQTPTGA